ncbi:MAG: ribosome biogenesis GTPase Der [Candidatus Mcinerneyibacterium aminivorans]|uniref:GTPase Der n=1 Tax=Candidatus Mcinerneyibacterium aminivorans TaxID=2703815 RepID=A0A5D0MEU0_9BACT|nr:MAG: ribosome biogenesis GTPase Der [Candidatus Mcinerneyibacterium aminivorans]
MKNIPYVTIIGRTNVGKSTLFNKLIRKNKAIIDDRPGVTRDRLYGHAKWQNIQFGLIDTAGLALEEDDDFAEELYRNVEIGIEEGDLILFLVDGKEGLASYDYEIADRLRKTEKDIILVKNKCEKREEIENYYDLYELGFEDIITVSAKHDIGLYELLDLIVEKLKGKTHEEKETKEDDSINLAITGRPNVGKSTLLNTYLGEYRSVVSDKWGTTRDIIDEKFTRNKQQYTIVDTAGIRRKSNIKNKLERYMVMRSLKAIDRSDVIIHLVEGLEGFTNQDDKILGYADERGVGIILAVNKWDAVDKDENTYTDFVRDIRKKAPFLDYASIHFISAKHKRNLFKLIDEAKEIFEINNKMVKDSILNSFLQDITSKYVHPLRKNKRVKVKHIKQVGVNPPTFVLFSNYPDLVNFAYKKYIKNNIRREFGFWGANIMLIFRRS